jgi:hypothetical protein
MRARKTCNHSVLNRIFTSFTGLREPSQDEIMNTEISAKFAVLAIEDHAGVSIVDADRSPTTHCEYQLSERTVLR